MPVETLLYEALRHQDAPLGEFTFLIALESFGNDPKQCDTSNIVATWFAQRFLLLPVGSLIDGLLSTPSFAVHDYLLSQTSGIAHEHFMLGFSLPREIARNKSALLMPSKS